VSGSVVLEALLRRDRVLVLGGLAALAALAWAATIRMARATPHGHIAVDWAAGLGLPAPAARGAADVMILFAMWTVMMAAMMLPSAAHLVLTYAAIQRKQDGHHSPVTPTALFLLGYLLAWVGFSGGGTLAQLGFQRSGLLTRAGESADPIFCGILLLVAGAFQWTPWKNACLSKCRSPLGFLMTRWRSGPRGALRMGLEHGAFCVGCCWALMALMFVAGMMNLLWLAALAAFCLLEKLLPSGRLMRHASAAGLSAWGIYMVCLGL